MKCSKNNIPRFHPYCKTKMPCHSNNFNAVNTIGLISKTVFTNARKWSWDTEMISHTNRNLSEIPHYPSFFLNALKISYIFYTYFNLLSICNLQWTTALTTQQKHKLNFPIKKQETRLPDMRITVGSLFTHRVRMVTIITRLQWESYSEKTSKKSLFSVTRFYIMVTVYHIWDTLSICFCDFSKFFQLNQSVVIWLLQSS